MADELTVSDRFRQTLKTQLALWRREGIVSPQQADLLAGRYRLEALGREGGNRLIFAIYMIGAALIACGVVSFIAWHWEGMAAGVKIALIVTTMLTIHATGFYLWKVRPGHEKLGHALVALGTLIFGANIGLMAQIFHVHSNWYNGLGAWALGAAAIACAAGSVPNALIALAASFLWWWGGIENQLFHSYRAEPLWLFTYYPLLVAAVFAPLAYSKRSAILFAATMLAIWFSALCVAGEQGGLPAWGMTSLALAAMFIGLAQAVAGGARAAFAAVSRMLACLAVAMAAYVYSIRFVAHDLHSMRWQRGPGQIPWVWLVALALLGGIAAFAYGRIAAGRRGLGGPLILRLGAGGLVLLGIFRRRRGLQCARDSPGQPGAGPPGRRDGLARRRSRPPRGLLGRRPARGPSDRQPFPRIRDRADGQGHRLPRLRRGNHRLRRPFRIVPQDKEARRCVKPSSSSSPASSSRSACWRPCPRETSTPASTARPWCCGSPPSTPTAS
ncbi:MAG: DUF2157 domain-containing protein [Planctomycetota bacterium]|nr:DUF2157 domain-containing protein [Planctomycetota bacterium]